MTLLLATLLAAPAEAGEATTTLALATNTLAHGFTLGAATYSVTFGEPEALAPGATGTHLALLTTPILLHAGNDLWGEQPSWQRGASWGLFATGVGVTALGWALVGFEPELGAAVMVLADLALIGCTAIVGSVYLADQAGWSVPIVSGAF